MAAALALCLPHAAAADGLDTVELRNIASARTLLERNDGPLGDFYAACMHAPSLDSKDNAFPRWQRCVAIVDSELGDALGAAWTAAAVSPERRTRATAVIDALIAAMHDALAASTWLDASGRTQTQRRLSEMARDVAKVTSDGELPAMSRTDFPADLRRAREARRGDISGDRISALATNAYYAPARNAIVVPAGLLQAPLLGDDAATNFGGLGALVGHELVHALRDWLTPAERAALREREDCVAAHIAAAGFDAERYRDETVADVGGLQLAMRALAASAPNEDAAVRRRFVSAFRDVWSDERSMEKHDEHLPAPSRAGVALSAAAECPIW